MVSGLEGDEQVYLLKIVIPKEATALPLGPGGNNFDSTVNKLKVDIDKQNSQKGGNRTLKKKIKRGGKSNSIRNKK